MHDAKACFIKALELDDGFGIAWYSLAKEGGGMVKGVSYDRRNCYRRAVELTPSAVVGTL